MEIKYSFHTITGGVILMEGTKTLFIPSQYTTNTKDLQTYIMDNTGYTQKEINLIMETWDIMGEWNPLQSFILSLINEEWANGSDKVGRNLQHIINTEQLQHITKNTPYQLAEQIHTIYFEEMEKLTEGV